MHSNFEYITTLQYRNKVLQSKLALYESGAIYQRLASDHKAQLREKDREIKRLKSELAGAHSETITVRKYWAEIFDDLDREYAKSLLEKDKINRALEDRLLCMAQHLGVQAHWKNDHEAENIHQRVCDR